MKKRRSKKETFPKRIRGLDETTGTGKKVTKIHNWRKDFGSGRRF